MDLATDFAQFILKYGIVGFFPEPVTLKSGAKSHFYVNWRRATNDAFLLDALTDYIVRHVAEVGLPCDGLYGVPEGATKTAILATMKLARRAENFAPGTHTVAMGRAKPKTHGAPEDRFFIGMPQGRTLVLEDTVTTGSSLFASLDHLLALGVNVIGALVLTDRSPVDAAFQEAFTARYGNRLDLFIMSHARDLVPTLLAQADPAIRARVLTELGGRA